MKVDITNSQLTILLEIDGQVHAVAFKKDELEAISFVVKKAIHQVIKTNRTQSELIKFIGIGE